MTYEKHKLTTDALDTLGSIIDETEKRDAIHLAVEPVVAAVPLFAGQHVKFDDRGQATWATLQSAHSDGIGIVDPFLDEPVNPGDRFWLIVYPRQITSLRHVWEHPSFPSSGETSEDQATEPTISETWLREWLAGSDLNHVPLEGIIQAVETGNWGDPTSDYAGLSFDTDIGFTSIGIDAYGQVPDEFWIHLANHLGHAMPYGLTADSSRIGCTC